MTTASATVLVVEDDEDMLDLFALALRSGGYEVRTASSGREALELLAEDEIDLVVSDVNLSDLDGIELCRQIRETRAELPVIFVTGQGKLETAVEAIRVGAYDFLQKPVDKKLLLLAVARASEKRRLHRELGRLRAAMAEADHGLPLRGASRAMRKILDLLARIGPSEASVLVVGETGTGKELVGRSVHQLSRRAGGPFVALNCAAIPPTLIESELFGHAKGAFTDAKTARAGLFRDADGGTLFLDELGELPLDVQAKLLRALQERTVRPVGGTEEVPFDARIVAATNRDLEEEVRKKRFRDDLYYRVNVVRVDLPPLRERGSDVLDLAAHFIAAFAGREGREPPALSAAASKRLVEYDWPGNVRELENCMERAIAMARGAAIELEDLPDKVRAFRAETVVVSADTSEDVVTLEELERRYIARVLKLTGGNKSRTATLLGLDRRTLYRKLAKESASGDAGDGDDEAG